jgi:hypothetical protein
LIFLCRGVLEVHVLLIEDQSFAKEAMGAVILALSPNLWIRFKEEQEGPGMLEFFMSEGCRQKSRAAVKAEW